MQQVVRFEIIKPIDNDWKVLGKVLRDLQYESRQVLNKTIQYNWEFSNCAIGFKEKFGINPKISDISKYKGSHALQNYIYNELKNVYTKISTSNLTCLIEKATSQWKTFQKDVYKGERNPPEYKKSNTPIIIHKQCINILKENGKYYADIALVSKKHLEEYKLNSCRFTLLLNTKNNGNKAILDMILNGELDYSQSQIIEKNKKWFLYLSYKVAEKVLPDDYNRIMGIDLGVNKAVVIAIHGTEIRDYIPGGEIIAYKNKMYNMVWHRQKQARYCGEGRIGHGRKTRLKNIYKIKEKIANFSDLTNHRYSKYIVELAKKHKCGVIQMEDLSGLSTNNKFLKKYPIYDLQQKIIYKAEREGIKVVKIKPNYTSQMCSNCHFISEENRPKDERGWEYFKCVNCGLEIDADLNAARNMANSQIENIIKEQLKIQGIKNKNNGTDEESRKAVNS
ncbi:MAG: IS200/IS605 family element transposase accessory protein TnpB [Ruminococcaceae bacterium]|nr:IS200/IS605 family element transposase accessory protein TnpB [Oscillospiraceae bacterium]